MRSGLTFDWTTGRMPFAGASSGVLNRLLPYLFAVGLIVNPMRAAAQAPEMILTPTASKYAGEILVTIHKSQIVRSPVQIHTVLIGDPKIADVVPLTDQSVYILGKALGSTSLTLYGPNKSLIAVADVSVSIDTEELKRRLYDVLPNEKIEVRTAGGAVVLGGTVSDANQLSRVASIASHYAEKVTNLLQVRGSQQVLLHVRFAEVQRSVIKELGINTNLLVQGADNTFRVASGFGAFTDTFGTIFFSKTSGKVQIDTLLNALEQKGVVKTLAEPNLIALSGDTANFLAGGEFPIPVVQNTTGSAASAAITIIFKSFGVGLAFTPTVLGDGLINLVVAPEVSAIDPTLSVTISGISVPGLTTRRARTTIELREGQSFAIAGLLQNNFQDQVRQFPILGDIPILGTLFRSSNYKSNQSELVIVVTPYRVKSTRPDQLLLPTDYFVAPSDFDIFFMGRIENSKSGRTVPLRGGTGAKMGGLDGPYGYILQ